jgi:hypothetical protein
VKKSFNIQELLHHKSKRHGTKPMHSLLVESFPKTPRTRSETSRFSGSHNDKTKQTTFLHRWILSRYPMAIMGKELKKEEERCFEK